jgi:hypothetical protein
MDSGIAPRNGRLTFTGRVRGMQPSNGAEVWLLVMGHGPANTADGSALAGMPSCLKMMSLFVSKFYQPIASMILST